MRGRDEGQKEGVRDRRRIGEEWQSPRSAAQRRSERVLWGPHNGPTVPAPAVNLLLSAGGSSVGTIKTSSMESAWLTVRPAASPDPSEWTKEKARSTAPVLRELLRWWMRGLIKTNYFLFVRHIYCLFLCQQLSSDVFAGFQQSAQELIWPNENNCEEKMLQRWTLYFTFQSLPSVPGHIFTFYGWDECF